MKRRAAGTRDRVEPVAFVGRRVEPAQRRHHVLARPEDPFDHGRVREDRRVHDAVGIEPPTTVNGIEQMPLDGVPMTYTFGGDGPSTRTTQYFEILGNRAIYHDGWMASCFHGRVPWIRMQAYEFDGPQERWELYDLTTDFSQSVDLADRHPERLEHLKQLFDEEARRHGVYPLRDAGSPRGGEFSVPHSLGDVRSMTYTTAHVRMPESSVVPLRNCSWRITAKIDGPRSSEVEGVIACQGGNMSGWSLWLEAGAPRFTYNCFGHDITTLEARALDSGRHDLVVEFAYDGGGLAKGGTVSLFLDGAPAGSGRVERTGSGLWRR